MASQVACSVTQSPYELAGGQCRFDFSGREPQKRGAQRPRNQNDIIIVDLVWSPKKGERSQLRLRLHRRE